MHACPPAGTWAWSFWVTARATCALQVNWAMNDKQEFIDIVEVVYRGARKGRGLVVSPKGECCAHVLTKFLLLLSRSAAPRLTACMLRRLLHEISLLRSMSRVGCAQTQSLQCAAVGLPSCS